MDVILGHLQFPSEMHESPWKKCVNGNLHSYIWSSPIYSLPIRGLLWRCWRHLLAVTAVSAATCWPVVLPRSWRFSDRGLCRGSHNMLGSVRAADLRLVNRAPADITFSLESTGRSSQDNLPNTCWCFLSLQVFIISSSGVARSLLVGVTCCLLRHDFGMSSSGVARSLLVGVISCWWCRLLNRSSSGVTRSLLLWVDAEVSDVMGVSAGQVLGVYNPGSAKFWK